MFFLNGVTLFKEAPSIKDMADFLGCSHQNANKLYAKLLQDGYIVSLQDENDRRKQRIYLTDKAQSFLADKKVGSSESVKEIFSVSEYNAVEKEKILWYNLYVNYAFCSADEEIPARICKACK